MNHAAFQVSPFKRYLLPIKESLLPPLFEGKDDEDDVDITDNNGRG
jgi:hypothetical protein